MANAFDPATAGVHSSSNHRASVTGEVKVKVAVSRAFVAVFSNLAPNSGALYRTRAASGACAQPGDLLDAKLEFRTPRGPAFLSCRAKPRHLLLLLLYRVVKD